ncbi:hypothetical protein Hanom_Chr11g00980231 [Helianthus anomalus]
MFLTRDSVSHAFYYILLFFYCTLRSCETVIVRLFCAAMGLKDALRLKSFDSTELDVGATKTPKGDPPYLNVVQENLYQIREPTAPVDQGGSADQGGSGSVPSIWTDGLERREGVRFQDYSVDDEGVNVEDEGDDDGAEARPQVSLKRGRTISSKSDPNPKLLKKKKLDFKTMVL